MRVVPFDRTGGAGGRGGRRFREIASARRHGSVLILVLVLMTVLTSLVVSGVLAVGSYANATARLRQRSEARRAALDALALFVENAHAAEERYILDPAWTGEPAPGTAGDPARGWIAPPSRERDAPGGVVDCEGRVNLNTAGRELLVRLFAARGGVDADSAAQLADSVLAWRGQTESPEASRRENRRYRVAKVAWRPPGLPLRSLETLRMIPGGDRIDLDRLAEWATVYGSGKININTADLDLLKIVFRSVAADHPAAAGRLIERLRAARSAGLILRGFDASILGALPDLGSVTPGEIVVWNRIAPRLGVESTCFEGCAVGSVDAAGPGAKGTERFRARFVWDAVRRKIVYWSEPGLL